jgi:ankyrin repeat protein
MQTTDNEFELRRAAREGNVEIVKSCIEKKVNLDADAYGLASIHTAALEGFVEIVKLLAENGATIELVDGLGIVLVLNLISTSFL